MNDSISRQAAVEAVADLYWMDERLLNFKKEIDVVYDKILNLPSTESELENKIRAIGYTGKEGRIYIGGRLFAVRELAQ